MADEPHLPQFNLKIDGAVVPKECMDAMLDCVVENSLHLPDVCTIRIHDAEFQWLDKETFKEGKKVEVQAGEGRDALTTIFQGEVTGIEMDLAGHGVPTIVVRCFSKAHRLHRGRLSRSFVQVTDTDIVRKVGQELGFRVTADDTSQVHDWVMQNNQTNWEFLQQIAARVGYRLYVKGEDELCFKKVEAGGAQAVKVEWGKTLRSFRPKVAASPQVDQVIVRGWDPKTKQAIVGRKTSPSGTPQTQDGSSGGQISSRAYGQAKMVVVDRPVHTQAEADQMAQSVLDHIAGDYLEAEGLCYAMPNLKPGMEVEVPNIGKRFSGKYYATSTTHTYTPAEGYATQFTVTGKGAGTLLSILNTEGMVRRAPLGGNVVVGVVTNNQDPDDLARVKVKYPWLTEEHESFWARLVCPMAGPDRGFEFIPEVDDEVLLAFEHGDIHRPFVIGALWNGKDKPVEPSSVAISGGKVNRRTIKTRIGHEILLDDTDDKGEISFTTKSGHKVILDDKNENIKAITKDGHYLILDDRNRKIVLEHSSASHKITLSPSGIDIRTGGDFTVQADGKVSIECKDKMDLLTLTDFKAKGLNATMEANMAASVRGTTSCELRSAGQTTVRGLPVTIN